MITDIQFPTAHIVPSKGFAIFEVYSKDTIQRVFIVKANSPKTAESKAKRFCAKYNHTFKSIGTLVRSIL